MKTQYKILIISIFFIRFFSKAYAAEKMNTCFITINSSEEKHLFKEKLSSGANKGKFDFHELVPMGTDKDDWFKKACEKKIRCDVLIISGHFGGSFFGSSGFNLGMNELETRSCKDDCSGILSSPKEVFLLGCNTLAGKEEDNRSAAEYLDVLLADNIPVDEASRIVEQRYGSIGTSFKDAMKRTFKGVPHIYGFHSIGPSGKNIEPLLKKYHQKIPNYYDHLLKAEVKRGLALMGDFSKWNKSNKEINQALKITNFTQTSGALLPCPGLEGVSKNDPLHKVLENICKLRAGELSEEESINHIRDILLSKDYALYLPVISDYIKDRDLQSKLKTLIKNFPSIKDNVTDLLKKSKTGFGKLKVAKIALEMSILSKEEFAKIEKEAVLSYLTPPVSIGSKDAICSYEVDERISININDLNEKIFTDPYGLGALECLNIDDRKIVYKILDTAKAHSNLNIRKSAILALMTSRTKDKKVIDFLVSKMKRGQSKDEQAFALYVLSELNQGNEAMYDKIKEMMSSNHTLTLMSESTPSHHIALFALSGTKLKGYSHFKEFYKHWKKEGRSEEFEDYVFSSSLAKLERKEIQKFLKDRSLFSEDKKLILIAGTRWYYGEFKNKKVKTKMPLEIFSELLDLYASGRDETQGANLEYVDLPSRKEEKKYLSLIEHASLNTQEMRDLILHFPLKVKGTSIAKFLVELHRRDPGSEAYIAEYLKKRDSLTEEEKEMYLKLRGLSTLNMKEAFLKHQIKF